MSINCMSSSATHQPPPPPPPDDALLLLDVLELPPESELLLDPLGFGAATPAAIP
jgi:hypothetical protein